MVSTPLPLLPVGAVRSVVTINNPPPPPSSSSSSAAALDHGDPAGRRRSAPPSLPRDGCRVTHPRARRRRGGLPVSPYGVNYRASVAVTSFCSDGRNGMGRRGRNDFNDFNDSNDGDRNNRECVTVVATCIAPRAGADDDECDSRCGRISLATIAESEDERRRRVVGVRYSSSSGFSVVCFARSLSQNLKTSTATMRPRATLLAIDKCGKLRACSVWHERGESRCEDENRSLDMRECLFDVARNVPEATPKRGKKSKSAKEASGNSSPPLGSMNALTTRLEFKSTATEGAAGGPTCASSQRESSKSPGASKSPAKRRGRKRNRSPNKKGAASIDAAERKKSERIHLVASSLNGSTLPSQSPPVVMILSSNDDASNDDSENRQWSGRAWSKIPGLENVEAPMTCILYASRSKFGLSMWDGIASSMRSNDDEVTAVPERLDREQCDEGVVLMGFQDGSLRASLIVAREARDSEIGERPSAGLHVGEAMELLRLRTNEPFISLQLLSPPSPVLICIGALGTMVTLHSPPRPDGKGCVETPKFAIADPLKGCGGRWTSMACVGYHFSETKDVAGSRLMNSMPFIDVSFIGVTDSMQSFFHRWSLSLNRQSANKANDVECGPSVCRLPIPARMASSVHAFPWPLHEPSECSPVYVTFTMTASTGKAVVSRMVLPATEMMSQSLTSQELCRGGVASPSLISLLKGKEGSAEESNLSHESGKTDHDRKGQPSKLQSLLQKLELATTKHNESETDHPHDSINQQSRHATKEIREATQICAFVRRPSSGNVRSPMQFEIKRFGPPKRPPKPGVLECVVTTEKLPLAKQPAAAWFPSVHVLQSCRSMLSPMLRPGSVDSMPPLCYRRFRIEDGELAKVLYGGTATSYSRCDINADLGRDINVDVPMHDFIPVSAYASLSMVYNSNLDEIVQSISDYPWHSSAKLVSPPSVDPWQFGRGVKYEAVRSEVLHLTGSAKSARRGNRSGHGEFLGVSIPFDMGNKGSDTPLLPFDILSSSASVDRHHAGENSARDAAENLVKHLSSYNDTQRNYLNPLAKEQHWIRNRSRSSKTVGRKENGTVYCCSTLMRHMSISGANALLGEKGVFCADLGFGPLAIVHRSGEEEADNTSELGIGSLGIAVGSSMLTPSESMSYLPLIRQAIVRRCLENVRPQTVQKGKDHLQLLELYRGLLSSKQMAKLVRHVGRSSEELLAKIEKLRGDACDPSPCPEDILATSISLYETLRTLHITLRVLA